MKLPGRGLFIAFLLSPMLYGQDATETGSRLLYGWVSNNSVFGGIVFVDNPGSAPAEVVFTARRAGGESAVATREIPARGRFSAEASALFPELGEGPGFSIVAESSAEALAGGWVTYNLTTPTGKSPAMGNALDLHQEAQAATYRGTSLLLPYLPTKDGLTSALVLVNTESEAASAEVSFYTSAGVMLTSTTLEDLVPLEPRALLVNDLLPADTAENVYARVEGERALSGTAFIFNQAGEPSIATASALPSAGANQETRLLFPWVSNSARFRGVVVIDNVFPEEVEVTLTARREGGAAETAVRSIPANGFLEEAADALFPTLGEGAGYAITAHGESAGLYGAWVTNNLDTPSGSSPSQGAAVRLPASDGDVAARGRTLILRHLPLTDGFTSAPVVVNTGDAPADIDLYFFNAAGERTGHERVIQATPNEPFARVANNLVSAAEDVYMIAESVQPLSGVAFVFNESGEPAIGTGAAIAPGLPPEYDLLATHTFDVSGDELVLDDFRLRLQPNTYPEPRTIRVYTGVETLISGQEVVSYHLGGLGGDYAIPPRLGFRVQDEANPPLVGAAETRFAPTAGREVEMLSLLDSQAAGGWLFAAVPLLDVGSSESSKQLQRAAGEPRVFAFQPEGRTLSKMGHFQFIWSPTDGVVQEQVTRLAGFLEEAYEYFLAQGYSYENRTRWPVTVKVGTSGIGADEFGLYTYSKWGKNYGSMVFNAARLDEPGELRRTAGHEFYHLVTALLDPRTGFVQAIRSGDHYWYNEASATFMEEKFTDEENYIPPVFNIHLDAPFKGAQAGQKGSNGSKRDHGYGMSGLAKFLDTTHGHDIHRTIWNRVNAGDHIIDAITAAAGRSVPSGWWADYIAALARLEIYQTSKGSLFQRKRRFHRIQGVGYLQSDRVNMADLSTNVHLIDFNLADDLDPNTSMLLSLEAGADQADIYLFQERSSQGNNEDEDPFSLLKIGVTRIVLDNLQEFDDNGIRLWAWIVNAPSTPNYTSSNPVEFQVETAVFTQTWRFVNNSTENIHILLPGENFHPSNRITPLASRTVTSNRFAPGTEVLIRAGRNASVLDTDSCVVDENTYHATATWNGSRVTCQKTSADE